MPVVRGRLSHGVFTDLISLCRLLFADLNETNSIETFQIGLKNLTIKPFCSSFAFARTGLYFLLKNLNLPKGTVVAMPPIIIKGYLDVVLQLNLKPKFYDIQKLDTGPNLETLEILLKKENAKVVILPYLFGMVPDVSKIMKIINKYDVFLIEDVSQALGCEFDNKKLGSFGDAAIYSSSAVKYLDTYGGGHVLVNDEALAIKLDCESSNLKQISRKQLFKKITLSFTRNLVSSKTLFPLFFYSMKFLKALRLDFFSRLVGSRSKVPISALPSSWFHRFSSLQASLGVRKLKTFDAVCEKVRLIADDLDNIIPIRYRLNSVSNSKSIRWQYIIFSKSFENTRSFFWKYRIDVCRTSLINISDLPLYGWNNDFFVAKSIYDEAIYIPFYPKLSNKNRQQLNRSLSSYFRLSF